MDKVPKDRIETNYIGNLKLGESGYTVPWAVTVSHDQKWCYLDIGYVYTPKPCGTSTMKVTRREDRHFSIDITGCGDYKWGKMSGGICVVGPVVRVVEVIA